MKKISPINWEKDKIVLIDQTALPQKLKFITCNNTKDVWQAIKQLKVRGAPLIGITAAYAVAQAAAAYKSADNICVVKKQLLRAIDYLETSRPTAVNLFWALERMRGVINNFRGSSRGRLKAVILTEAKRIFAEDKRLCAQMAGFGAKLIKSGDTILTHCNAGKLATGGVGTALGVIYKAKSQGKKIRVFATETRPLLQGARLTTWELSGDGVDVTLICDNMAASLMQKGKIDKVFVGADRIAANGDTANKIGTYSLAVLAKYHHIPFYVVAPTSTFDFSLSHGSKIPIEYRDEKEVKAIAGILTAPKNIRAYNPAFDLTTSELIRAIITEHGIISPPFAKTIKKLYAQKFRSSRNFS
ncbi:MAG: S-methyl-5-thioribose-1-phosphate isomerase [Candidatus Omnitrophota bacterium]